MKKFNGYDDARKNAESYGASLKIPAGGYIAKILGVRYENGENGNSDRIVVQYDFIEVEFAGCFKKQYEENTSDDKKWKGKTTIYVPKDDGTEMDTWTSNAFAKWTYAFEESNPGYKWDWDESKWKGLIVGLVYGEVGTVIDGKEIEYTECRYPATVENVRNGSVKAPKFKAKNGYKKGSATVDSNGFMSIPDGAEEEIPF